MSVNGNPLIIIIIIIIEDLRQSCPTLELDISVSLIKSVRNMHYYSGIQKVHSYILQVFKPSHFVRCVARQLPSNQDLSNFA